LIKQVRIIHFDLVLALLQATCKNNRMRRIAFGGMILRHFASDKPSSAMNNAL
jgi:hypothetical protein